MMSPLEALDFIKRASGKMGGLNVAECRVFDNCLSVLEQYLAPKPEPKLKKPELVAPAGGPLDNNHYP